MPGELDEERESVADELRRVREAARDDATRDARADPRPAAPADPAPPASPSGAAATTDGPLPAPRPAPSAREVNESWAAAPGRPRGGPGALLERLLAPRLQAQRDWNAAQVRLDNEILAWVEERFAATHARYDALAGQLGRRLDEADERHRILERELLAHVRDLVARIDLAMADASRGRASHAQALLDLRERLARLESGLARRG